MSEVTPDLPGAPRGEHPATEVLRAYREGRLGADEQEALQEHLVSCDWCAELLLGLAPRAEEGATVASHETAADWRKLRQRLAGEGALPAKRRAARLPVWVGWAAAAFWLISVGTAWYAWTLRKELSQPDLYAAFGSAASGTTRSERKVVTIEAPSQGRFVTVELELPPTILTGEYRVELSDPIGKVLWSGPWVNEADSTRFLTGNIPRRLIPEEGLRIRILGSPPGRPLAEYAIRVVSP